MIWKKRGLIFDLSAMPSRPDWMHSHASVPFAEPLEGDRVRIYFTARNRANQSHVGSFTIDLRNPNEISDLSRQPILSPGDTGMFDDSGAMLSWIASAPGSRKFFYYIGWNRGVSVPFRNAIGVAIQSDGAALPKKFSPGPILDRGVHDPGFTASSCVLREGGVWRMWYLSCIEWARAGDSPPLHRYHIKYAESRDGLEWTRAGRVCIDFKSPDEYAISRPCVLKEGDRYRMWYSCRGDSYRIGYAESADGLVWTRKDGEAGIDVSASGWDSRMIEYPHVFSHRGKLYMLYNGNDFGRTGIGLAEAATDSKN